MTSRSLLALALSVAAMCVSASPAAADVFEPIQLMSKNPLEQADYAHDTAISADGRYVAFDGSFGGVPGVWRRDVATGAVEAVVECQRESEYPCARMPSISAEGRYVSFTTTLQLDPAHDHNLAPDVYVRDMNSSTPCSAGRAEGAACEYELASARSGSLEGLAYAYGESPAFEEGLYGATASGRSALTADGRHVVFVTTAESNLAGEHTPKLQIAVRDLDTHATRLVTVLDEGGPTERPVPLNAEGIGAVYPGGSEFSAWAYGRPASALAGASISADGSTVAWMGQELERQARLLPAERNVFPGYTEPLWRRIADGPSAPTRRVTGGGDPESAACAASGERTTAEIPTLSDPCQGPFDPTYSEGSSGIWALGSSGGEYVPQLSANGEIVAFLSSAREIAAGEAFTSQPSSDLYVANMKEGLTRVQSLRRLTELAGGSVGELARTGPIVDVGLSPDGTEVAFSTRRTVFPLGSPAFVSPPAAELGMANLFDADLANDTVTRVTQGFRGEAGEPAIATSGTPSFSADGNVLAFSSTAGNLVYGDGNTPLGTPRGLLDGSDAFIARREALLPTTAETYVSPAPPGPSIEPVWSIGATAETQRDGSVLLAVLVPAAGTLSVDASGQVPLLLTTARHRGARRATVRTVTRTVASQSARELQPGVAEMTVRLAPRYAKLAMQGGGFDAVAVATFTAPGHTSVSTAIDVKFSGPPQPARRAARRARHSRRPRGARP